MNHSLFFLICFLFLCWHVSPKMYAQSDLSSASDSSSVDLADPTDKDVIYKERGLNMTPFLVQFIPLGKSGLNLGPIGYQMQSIKNGQLYRFGIGLGVDANQVDGFVNMRFGIGKEIPLTEQWTYYRGTDLWLFVGTINVPASSPFFDPSTGIGIAPFVGLKFHVNSYINLATESHFFFGISSENPVVIQIIPPLALLLNVRLPKDRLRRANKWIRKKK